MYVHPFKVAVGGSLTIPIPTRGTDSAAVTGNTLADGDFAVHINGSTTAATIAAGATTPSTDFASATGRNQLVIDTSQDSDFALGAYAHVWLTKTIDSIAIQECVAIFFMESAADRVLRLWAEKTLLTSLVVTTTNNSTTVVNLTDFVDAQTVDGDLVGSVWRFIRAATDQAQVFVVVSVSAARQFNVVVKADGSALDNAVAANDFIYFEGWDALRATVPGRTFDVASNGALDADSITAILTTAMTEAYAADGAAPTLAQALFLIQQALTEFSVSGTTMTIKKLDGSTSAGTLTLSDATTPTSITRAT